ncbi:MAG: hypothetical protein ACI865_003074 [Flavobacteriaceae bacterium]|jgi:hypothetical protein
MRIALILSLTIIFPFLALTQSPEIEKAVIETGQLQELRLKSMFEANRDSVFEVFQTSFDRLIGLDSKVNDTLFTSNDYFRVDLPSEKMAGEDLMYSFVGSIVVSNSRDGKLRFFSSDNLDGGSWHNYTNHYQSFSSDKDLVSKAAEMETYKPTDDELDAGIYNVEQFDFQNSTYYLTFGYGTEGAGNHHHLVKAYTLEEDSIVNQNLFSLAARIDIISKRFQQANLTYDEKKGTISYSEFEETYIEETGEYTYKKRTVSWIFEDGQFVKSSL